MTTSEIELKKQSLLQDSQTYSTNITSDLHSINSNLQRVGLTALLAGAALVTTYYLASKIFGKSKSKKQWVANENNAGNQVVSMRPASTTPNWYAMVKEQMMLFVLAMLKQKLAEYLESIDKEAVMGKISGFFASTTTKENTKPLDSTIPY